MLAKFLDIPSVIVRTDFREGGEQNPSRGGEPWNLMCSFWPRTEVLLVHGMAVYQEALHSTKTPAELIARATSTIASQLIERLDRVMATPPLMPADRKVREAICRWTLECAGGNLLTEELSQKVLELKS